MADRMTPEQVATLELPNDLKLQDYSGSWRLFGSTRSTIAFALGAIAEHVANGHLPRSVYDWAWRAYKGGDVPTVEQWEAAARLVALTRNDAHPDSIVAKLANIIAPPKPPPLLPEIAACPYCGGECGCYSAVEHGRDMTGWYVSCQSRGCPYVSPPRLDKRETIETHNEVAAKLRPVEVPKPKQRTCGGCRHWHLYGGCGRINYWGETTPTGTLKVLDRPASTTRDASECERWEPKP